MLSFRRFRSTIFLNSLSSIIISSRLRCNSVQEFTWSSVDSVKEWNSCTMERTWFFNTCNSEKLSSIVSWRFREDIDLALTHKSKRKLLMNIKKKTLLHFRAVGSTVTLLECFSKELRVKIFLRWGHKQGEMDLNHLSWEKTILYLTLPMTNTEKEMLPKVFDPEFFNSLHILQDMSLLIRLHLKCFPLSFSVFKET